MIVGLKIFKIPSIKGNESIFTTEETTEIQGPKLASLTPPVSWRLLYSISDQIYEISSTNLQTKMELLWKKLSNHHQRVINGE